MKAALLKKYDKNNLDLTIEEVAKPVIKPNQVLLRVKAAGVNPLDNMITRGQIRLLIPYKLPQVMGNELVGIVEEVGKNVKQFQTGERVFARLPFDQIGAFAEYIAVDASALAKVPGHLSDQEAAAVPLTALTVMQAFDLMKIEAGKTIFISGGTGGVGGMAIPLAKAKGLRVITNGSARNKERVMGLGADQFIDYKTEDYSTLLKDIDYVLDTLGGAETEKQLSILKKGGHLVNLPAMPNGRFAKRMGLPKWKQILFGLVGRKFDKLAEKYGATYDFIFVEPNGHQLQEVANILSELEIKPSLDTVFSFDEVNKALDKVANGRSQGKTVLSFEITT